MFTPQCRWQHCLVAVVWLLCWSECVSLAADSDSRTSREKLSSFKERFRHHDTSTRINELVDDDTHSHAGRTSGILNGTGSHGAIGDASGNKPWVFYHVRKCAGWTIVKYFETFLYNQAGNKCDPKQQYPKDWRCMVGGFENPRPSVELQLAAFDKFVSSRYTLSHVEFPLKEIQAFVPNIHYITVLRHPIERVISSYGMMKGKACFDNCTLQLWLRRQCHLNPKVQLGSVATSTIGKITKTSGIYTTGELDINYMTRWLSGKWTTFAPRAATTQDFYRAKENLGHMDFIFLTAWLNQDLPLVAKHFLGSNSSSAIQEGFTISDSVTAKHVRELLVETSVEEMFCGNVTNILKHTGGSVALYQDIISKNKLDIKLYLYGLGLYCGSFIKSQNSACADSRFLEYYKAFLAPDSDYYQLCEDISRFPQNLEEAN